MSRVKTKISLILILLATGLILQAQKLEGTYAYSKLDKYCLKLEPNNRFDLFSSTCSHDYHHVGSWKTAGDTLILDSDRKPRLELKDFLTVPGDDPLIQVLVASSDPALLQQVVFEADGEKFRLSEEDVAWIPRGAQDVQILAQGFVPVSLPPMEERTAVVEMRIEFVDMHVAYLQNDRWLINGKKLDYLTPAIEGSETISLKKGKRCFYRQ
jgi:hypothetical protein